MERTDIFDLMAALKLYGMRAAYDEVMAAGIKRECEPPRIVGDLLEAEIAEKQARSIKYQLTIAKLPLAKDIDDFHFAGTPINETLVRELATGASFPCSATSSSSAAPAPARAISLSPSPAPASAAEPGPLHTVVDLVNRLESEARGRRQGRLADYLTRLDFAVLDELGYLPSPRPAGMLFYLISRSTSARRSSSPPTRLRRMAERVRRCEDDDGAPRSSYPSLRDHRDRQRVLALQEPRN